MTIFAWYGNKQQKIINMAHPKGYCPIPPEKRFQKGKSGNPKGRPKKVLAWVNTQLEKEGYSEAKPVDITSCYLRLINIPLKEVKKMSNDATQPSLVQIVGKAILSSKGFEIVEKMLDRGIGKALERMKVENTELKEYDLSKLSDEELDMWLKLTEKSGN